MGKLGTFVALGVRGRGMIENRSFNLVEFCVIMGKTNRNLEVHDDNKNCYNFTDGSVLHLLFCKAD